MLLAELQFHQPASIGFLFIYFRYSIDGVNLLLRCDIYISSQVSACSVRALVYILHAGCCYYTTELVDKINFFPEHVSDHLSNYAIGRTGDFVSAKLQQMGSWCSLWFVPEVWRSESLWGGGTGTNLRTYIHTCVLYSAAAVAKTESGEEEKSAAASAPPSEQWPTFSPEGGKKGLCSRQWEFEGWEGMGWRGKVKAKNKRNRAHTGRN